MSVMTQTHAGTLGIRMLTTQICLENAVLCSAGPRTRHNGVEHFGTLLGRGRLAGRSATSMGGLDVGERTTEQYPTHDAVHLSVGGGGYQFRSCSLARSLASGTDSVLGTGWVGMSLRRSCQWLGFFQGTMSG